MNISIVIPVYNEADSLDACLQSIATQTTEPLEVFVVDNNSTDQSVQVAQKYSFVKVLHESRQGVVHARNLGFNKARGDVIGRIDADTILPSNWIEKVKYLFESNTSLSAVSGSPHYYDFVLSGLADQIDSVLRSRLAKKLGSNNFLWGANMAIRRSAWKSVRSSICAEKDIHEDFDLAIHLQELGCLVAYEPGLLASVSSRRIDTDFKSYVRYSLISPRTYKVHGLSSRYHMYPIILIAWGAYIPARLLYKGYDHSRGEFSLNKLFSPSRTRIDPTINIV
ncbi:MAG: glycosyltransferase [Candidatus Saccharimonadales bacterium]